MNAEHAPATQVGAGRLRLRCTAVETYHLPDRAIGFWVDELAEMARVPRLDAPSAAALWAVMRKSAPPTRDA